MSASAPPPTTARQPVPALVRKAEFEAAMAAAPGDSAVRQAYFEHLAGLTANNTGLLWVSLPELDAPLAIRSGTPDLLALAEVFNDNVLAVEMQATPLRILLLGAYAGYSAVNLAQRYPRAEILAVEPLADNVRLLRVNTLAWPRIRVLHTAAWHSATRLAAMGRGLADWSVRLADEGIDTYRILPALSVSDVLAEAGWDHADLIVCDVAGSETQIFADRLQSWIGLCDALLIRLAEIAKPGNAETVAAAFPPALFDHRPAGAFDLFTRREPRTAQPALPAPLALLRAEPGLKGFHLTDVPQAPWGFFVFGGGSCQLHPNGVGGRPSRAIFGVPVAGHQRFISGVTHAGLQGGFPVVFSVFAVRNDGSVAAQAEVTVAAQYNDRLSLRLPEITAPYHIVLQTEMVAGAPHHRLAWARWIEPRLV